MPTPRKARKGVTDSSAAPLAATPVLPKVEEWLASRQRLILVLLASLSILIRAGYYVEAKNGPLLYQHLWSEADMGFFDHWAKVIIGGDPVGRQVQHPFFGWQAAPAEAYFRTHPEQIAEYERSGVPKGDTDALYRALWDRWTHGKEFYQEPLYVYLVALTYKILGPNVQAVFAWQMALGVLTNLLIYGLARRYFGEIAAAVSALFLLFYSPLFIYDLTLLRSTLTAFLAAAMVAAVEWALESDSWRRWFAAGAVIGLAMTCQSTFLVFVAGSIVLIWIKFRRQAPRLAVVLVCGAALAVSPIIARNVAVGVPPFSWTGAGVWTFVRFNAPSADPVMGQALPNHPDHLRILAASDARAIPAVLATLREHSAGSLAHLLFFKFQKVWNWYEEGDNVNFYYSRLYSAVLRYSPATNTLIAPLLLVGLGLWLRAWKRLAPLYLLALNAIFVLMVTYPTGRYRAAYFAVLIPFAGGAAAQFATWSASGNMKRAAALASVVAAAFLWTSLPLPPERPLIWPAYYISPYQYYWEPLRNAAVQHQDWKEAARIDEEGLRSEPVDLSSARNPDLIQLFGSAHALFAGDLQKSGDPARAHWEVERAKQMAAWLGPAR